MYVDKFGKLFLGEALGLPRTPHELPERKERLF